MKKRILSILLACMMCISMLPTVALAAGNLDVKVTASATNPSAGDTVTFTVSIGAVTNLQSMEFVIDVPAGMTYVASSAKLQDGLKDTLNVASADWTELTQKFTMYGDGEYTSSADTTIMTFDCSVDDSASGTLSVSVKAFSAADSDYEEITANLIPASVTVAAAPKPATAIELNKSTLELTVGESETLVATVTPADTTDTVTWDTGRSDVATVDSTGKVTAVAPGTAVIAARAGEKSAFCTVTVVSAPCTHLNKVSVPAKASTCEEQGWEGYSRCEDCGQLFDKHGNEISAIPYLSLADHTPAQTATVEYLKTAATCTSKAVYFEHCSVCGEKLATTFESGELMSHTESGWKRDADGHWKECTVCGTITTTKVAHTPDHEGNATEEYAIKCSVCDWEIEAQLGHTHSLNKVEHKAATCTDPGNEAYYVCSGCSKWFEDATGNVEITDHSSVVIGAQGHDWADATCTDPKTCKRCGETEGTALGHDWADATCTDPKTCTRCGETEGEALDHSYATEWSHDSTNHWHACTRCGDKVDLAAHDYGTDKTCDTCGYTKSSSSSDGGSMLTYTITVESAKNGTVTSSAKNAAKGTTVTLTVKPDAGYELEELTVVNKNGAAVKLTEKNGKYTFTMPASKVTVKAAFAAIEVEPVNPFEDVADDAYYNDAVIWAVENGITDGITSTSFAPNAACTRAQAVTFLWRTAGCPAPKSTEMPFTDVAESSYYYNAVLWAVENGITDGTSATTFSPNADCTRAHIVTFLWRAQGCPAAGAVNPFTDVAADAYYNSAVLWAVEQKITDGTSATTFSPDNNCTRAQIVTFLYRCAK